MEPDTKTKMKISRTLNSLVTFGLIYQNDQLYDTRKKANYLLEKGLNLLFTLYSLLDYHFNEFSSFTDEFIKKETLENIYTSLLEISQIAVDKDWVDVDLSQLKASHKEAMKVAYTYLSTDVSLITKTIKRVIFQVSPRTVSFSPPNLTMVELTTKPSNS